MKILVSTVFFLISLHQVSGLSQLEKSTRDFLVSYYKHMAFRDPDIFDPDYKGFQKDDQFETYDFVVERTKTVDDNIPYYSSKFKKLSNFSNSEWESYMENVIAKINEDGHLVVKMFKQNRLDFAWFLKRDESIEGGYKIVRYVRYS